MTNIQSTLMADITTLDIDAILEPILSLFNTVLVPVVLAIVATFGVITIITKLVKKSKAEDENQIMAANKALVNSIVCFVAIFLTIVILNVAIPELAAWLTDIDLTTSITGSGT